MLPFYIPIILTVLSSVLYHLAQKLTSTSVHPLIGLTATYITALLVTLLLLPFFPLKESLSASLRHLNWASFVLGIVIVGLEVGYLLAYRVGWDISLTAVFSNVAVGLILLPVGLLAFKDRLSPANIIGVLVCIGGLYLINLK